MGYFANGSEGMDYEAQYCDRCVHQNGGCAVWDAHMIANYTECNNPDSILHILIPRTADGLDNEQCTMFVKQTR
jgi:hypothetical protein